MIFELLEIIEPKEPNIAPNEINRIENHKTKRAEPSAARPLLLTSVMPAAYDKYPGTNGRTQGEANEINPANIATADAINRFPSKTISTKKSNIDVTS